MLPKQFTKRGKIGFGAYSDVYKMEMSNGDIIAMKKFKSCDIHPTLLRELALMKLCDHPNVVKMLKYDDVNFKWYTMPLYEGHLKDFIDQIEISLDLIKNITIQILKGVNYLHSMGICHRDIKPQNILFKSENNENKFVIADIGISHIFDPMANGIKTPEVCTLWYRPPEILLGDNKYSHNIDVWSVGCVIAEVATKKPLFPGDSEINQLYKIFQLLGTPNEETWPGISSLRSYPANLPIYINKFEDTKMDQTLLNFLKKLLEPNPLKRYSCKQALEHSFLNQIINNDYLTNLLNWEFYSLKVKENNKRNKLLSWLFEVKLEYYLLPSTFIRAQKILDRYCQDQEIESKHYHLAGITSLFIASKIEELCGPSIMDMVYICDNIYTEPDIEQMEKIILKTLDIDVYFPTTYTFLNFCSLELELDEKKKKEFEFLLIFLSFSPLTYHPSVISLCAALYIVSAQSVLKESDDEIIECMREMSTWLDKNKIKSFKIIYEHYSKRIALDKY